MTLVGDKNETFDDAKKPIKRRKKFCAYPNIKGMQGSASTDVAGIGLAIEERGLENLCLAHLCLRAGQYLKLAQLMALVFGIHPWLAMP